MQYVELTAGIKSSALGFGCASIQGAIGPGKARAALGLALDVGITHFDLARSYGFGDAEALVGTFLRDRRDQVVLATKFGIVATPIARAFQALKPAVRLIRAMRPKNPSPPPGRAATRQSLGDRFHARLPFTAANMRISLEASLRALRTDRVEYLFLHEPAGPIADFEGLIEEAERLKQEGKIRAWGAAFMLEHRKRLGMLLNRVDVWQYDLSPSAADYENVRTERADHPNVFFSPFKGGAIEVSREEILRRLSRDFPRSVVLCSMFSAAHIRANASVF